MFSYFKTCSNPTCRARKGYCTFSRKNVAVFTGQSYFVLFFSKLQALVQPKTVRLSNSNAHKIGIDRIGYMLRWVCSTYWNMYIHSLAPPFLQEELTALRLVQSMYGSLEMSYPLALFRELRRVSGILALAEMSFGFHLIRAVARRQEGSLTAIRLRMPAVMCTHHLVRAVFKASSRWPLGFSHATNASS